MSFLEFVSDQRKILPVAVSEQTCSGKTYIVTGANTGLGLEAARHLTRCSAQKVIVAVRNTRAGETAKQDIESTTGIRNVLEVWPLDLSSYASVRSFAERASAELPRIDAVIENAGVALDSFKRVEGHEQTIMTNVLSTVLLAVLLLPKLAETAKKHNVQPHIAIVSSEVAFHSPTKPAFDKISSSPLENLDKEEKADMSQRYPLSKLVLDMAVRELCSMLPFSKTGVVVNYVNPGLCKTALSSNAGIVTRLSIGMMNVLLGRTPEEGSRNLLYAAVAPKESHGCYLSSCAIEDGRVPSWITDGDGQRDQRRVWDDVARELERVQLGCISRVLQL